MSDRQQRLVQILFRLWSPFYDLSAPQKLFYRPVHRALLGAIPSMNPRAALDLGCGTGQLTADLRARFPSAKVVGADLSHDMLAQSRERALCAQANVYALPFADGTFDLVTSSISYHFYLDPPRALAQIARVLAPGGIFALATLAPRHPGRLKLVYGDNLRIVGIDEVERDLVSAGFRVLSTARTRLVVGVLIAKKSDRQSG